MPRFEHGDSDLWSNTLPLYHGGAELKDEEVDTQSSDQRLKGMY